jgi:hypothetical protein
MACVLYIVFIIAADKKYLSLSYKVLPFSCQHIVPGTKIDFKERKPFSMLLLFVLILFILFIYPYAVFIFAMAYLIWGIIENIFLFFRNRKIKREHQNAAGQPE